jgi:hypothetical protein
MTYSGEGIKQYMILDENPETKGTIRKLPRSSQGNTP